MSCALRAGLPLSQDSAASPRSIYLNVATPKCRTVSVRTVRVHERSIRSGRDDVERIIPAWLPVVLHRDRKVHRIPITAAVTDDRRVATADVDLCNRGALHAECHAVVD